MPAELPAEPDRSGSDRLRRDGDPWPLLAQADQHFSFGELTAAQAMLAEFRSLEPTHYRGFVLEAKLHRARGDLEASSRSINEAVAREPASEVAAHLEFLSLRVEQQKWDICDAEFGFNTRDIINLTMLRCRDTDATRWYQGRLQFLRGLASLAIDDWSGAQSDIEEAYAFHGGDLKDHEFLFAWVVEKLKDAERWLHYPNLKYLAWVAKNRKPTLSYDHELERLGDNTFVLEIGAMDGVRFDPLRRHLTSRPWHAVLVEPTKAMYASLVKNYAEFPNVRCLKVAISDRNGVANIHFIKPEIVQAEMIGDWALGKSSLIPIKNYEQFSDAESVPTLTFDSLVRQESIHKIDVLQIDTEGHDYEIFRQIDLRMWTIRLINIEIIWLMPAQRLAIVEALEATHYRLSYDGNDLTAMLMFR